MTDLPSMRTRINRQIETYWKSMKKTLDYKPIKSKKVPNFTRHNGNKLKRLSRSNWRYPKSCQGNRAIMTVPKIGYKRPAKERGALRAYGMKPAIVVNIQDLKEAHGKGYLPILSRTLGAKKRQLLLNMARESSIPLILRR